MEQTWKLKKQTAFHLKDIFECGQCFRWNQIDNSTYVGVVKHNVIQVKEQNDTIFFRGVGQEDLKQLVVNYFDLNTDYDELKKQLSKVDDNLKKSTIYGKGIRLLNQPLWETIVSFILSANNNIPRIKGMIDRLCRAYGNQIEWEAKTYYTFPTKEQLKDVTVEQYRALGFGFRDKRVYETVALVLEGKINLSNWYQKPTQEVRKELLTLSGVGPKVADCILLFSDLKRLDVFPIDVWVRRVMNELYIGQKEEEKVSKETINRLAEEKFGSLKGLAQQYLFYWRRDDEKKQA